MKRKFNLSLLITLLFLLVSCNNSKVDDDINKDPNGNGQVDEDPNKNEEDENGNGKEEIDLKELKYYEYLSDDNPLVIIKVKDFGELHIQLFGNVAENTVNNFLTYVLDNKYDGSSFHRVIEGFMIQGGQVNKTNKPIKGEFSSNGFVNDLKHFRGVISMARTMYENSATSQFFVMHEISPHLDGQYASFGGLVKGFDVLDQIATVSTNRFDGPLKTIVIESVTVNLNGYEMKDVIYFQ